MSETHDKGPLLGQQVSGSAVYDPGLLFPVPRANARVSLPDGRFEGYGEDIWHAYELSWLSAQGMPQMFTGVISVPATSMNIVESKSLKLYLNSLNNHRFDSVDHAIGVITHDLSAVAQASVGLELFGPDDRALGGVQLNADCLDDLLVEIPDAPEAASLRPTGDAGARLCTHLMRSRCPVTDQPDWATVIIETRDAAPERESLLAYLLAYRNHQEFHEQCVERIFTDLADRLAPSYLSVQALYTRRGGLDISPWRCSDGEPAPRGRMSRQ
ncbi:MAG: NADPH-dependent 7-cyano-7-deazaguanine reductase QueF [Pseudomonadota bacterium]